MAAARESVKVLEAQTEFFLVQVCSTILLPIWGTWHLLTLFSTASQVLQEETIKSFVEKVAGSLAEAICERPDNWQPSGALQASHLQCQEEAVLEWKAYVEHWLQLRVVKTTSSQREKKESPTQWPWLMKPPRHNVPIFWFVIYELPSYQGARRRPPR